MVESVTNAAISTLLRAQSTGTSAGIAALKSNKQATQAIITQLQEGLNKGKATMALANAGGNAAPASSLPRGSLIDIVV